MAEIIRSLWLPVGRENFFSPMTDPKLLVKDPDGRLTGECKTERHVQDPDYIPHLRESVLRRLVEVLPYSFAYRRLATVEFCEEPDESDRPVAVTLTLPLGAAEYRSDGTPRIAELAEARRLNTVLREAGVRQIVLRADENGFYAFVATCDERSAAAEQAVTDHVTAVFGGAFAVDRLSTSPQRRFEGMNAVRRYNGLVPRTTLAAGASAYDEEEDETAPLGALSFHQLNIMVEAICNQSLLPAVFFEHYDESRAWLERTRGRVSVITELKTFIEAVVRPADARTPDGQVEVLRRFMVITRGSLQWLTRSVDSVRRSLLDKMMAVSHRRARLIQLDLGGIGYERTPELTGEASESQMRGYVVLIATKLPLIHNVAECIADAVQELGRRVGPAVADPGQLAPDPRALPTRVRDLALLKEHWQDLLRVLRGGVASLTEAVSQDWQERLLYEQEQARSEQEAMAEIERSRRGVGDRRRGGEMAYNAIMLGLTVVTVLVAIPAVKVADDGDTELWEYARKLWWLLLVPLVVPLVTMIWSKILQHRRRQQPDAAAYGYEFAFRLDETASPRKVHELLTTEVATITPPGFGKARLRRLGGLRTDKISRDTELLKVHSVVALRLRRRKYARFEIVVEIIIRKIADMPQYYIRHCRIFGDSPEPISLASLEPLVAFLVDQTCRPMAKDEKVATGSTGPLVRGGDRRTDDHDLDHLIVLTHPIYAGEEPEPEGGPDDGEPPTRDGIPVIPRPREGEKGGVRA